MGVRKNTQKRSKVQGRMIQRRKCSHRGLEVIRKQEFLVEGSFSQRK